MKHFYSIRWKITLAYLLVLVSIAALGIYLSKWTESYYVTALRSSLLTESKFVGKLCESLMTDGPEAVDPLVKQAGKELEHRVTIITVDGKVLGDSHSDYSSMESHEDRPEVRKALEYGEGWAIRYSSTIHTRMLYTATRIGDKAHPLGVVRLAENLSNVDHARGIIHRMFFLGALAVFIIAVIVGAMLSKDVSAPITAMGSAARKFAKGDLNIRIKAPELPGNEIDELAITLNGMASELRRTLDELKVEKGKLQTIFDKADDGIIMTDENACIQMINPVASDLLGVDVREVREKTVIEATLSHDISELVSRVLHTGIPASLEVQISEESYVNVHVIPLERPGGNSGAMIMMHDLTAAKQIDAIRRDFVENVSHELRTPLASIKAMAETIILRGNKGDKVASSFAQKIVEEAGRLAAVSEDLLDLAKIESGRRSMFKESFLLSELTDQILTQLGRKAEQEGNELSTDVPGDLMICCDRDALHQILINLVDNAVKYTPEGGRITVFASVKVDNISISVADTGIGIPSDDLPRIFERFYRVDKARSRESGGTGLGLSIVKHLCELLGAGISVSSELGKGTTFTLTLPLA